MLLELNGKAAAAYRYTVIAAVIRHHQQSLKLIDAFRPRIKRPSVQALADSTPSPGLGRLHGSWRYWPR
jgi:uncharacterized protein (DUF305 family)